MTNDLMPSPRAPWPRPGLAAVVRRCLAALAVLVSMTIADGAEQRILPGHLPRSLSRLAPTGRAPATNEIRLCLGLGSRDAAGLAAFLKEVYDPASPQFRRYLSPEQFTKSFGPTEESHQAVVNYAKLHGLEVTRTYPNRVILDVRGPVATVERAFHVQIHTYRHPTEARTFYAPDREPSVDAAVPLVHIVGLDNYSIPRSNSKIELPDAATTAKAAASPQLGSAPHNYGLWGNDFRNAYVPGTPLTGAGQSVGIVAFEAFYPSDVTLYENGIGMSPSHRPQIIVVPVVGGSAIGDNPDNGVETTLDIDMAVSMAPGLKSVYVFETSNGYFDDIFESMISYTNILQFTCSWGGTGPADPAAELLFQQMAAQGQSFFTASGDHGSYVDGDLLFPADSPSVTVVGGTTLSDGPAPAYPWTGEVVWNSGVSSGVFWGTGGGVSTNYAIPAWQTNINMAIRGGSPTMRNIPDVAANALNVYNFINNGQQAILGGTSAASPLWAGFAALVNQEAAANGRPSVGFLNPALYSIAAGSNYAACFHDVTMGANTWSNSPNLFHAAAGYDLCTGLGSMTGTNLIDALAGAGAALFPAPPPAYLAPVITESPTNQTVVDGAPPGWTVFQVGVSGPGPFTFQWRFNGTGLTDGLLANGSTVADSAYPAMGVYAATAANVGAYDVVVSNPYGSATSSPALLLFAEPPSIAAGPTNQTVAVGGTARFSATVSGTGPLSFQWRHASTNIADGAGYTGSGTASLGVADAQAADAGVYDLVVTSPYGSATSAPVTLALTAAPPGVILYITGSGSFRRQIYNALTSTKVGGRYLFDRDGAYAVNPNFNGGNAQFRVSGHISGLGVTSQVLTVSCAFSGSVEGIVSLLGLPQPANAVSNLFLANASDSSPTVNPAAITPDVAFSDCQQDTTLYAGDVNRLDFNGAGFELTDATGVGVGILPFGVAGSKGAHAPGFTNVAHQALLTLLQTGRTMVKQFTGNPADTAAVYLTGDYNLSGARIITQATTGFGAVRNGVLYTVASGVPTFLWSGVAGADTVNGGYTIPGGVAGLLAAGTPAPFLGYASWSDLAAWGLTPCAYDGVPLSKAAVAQGWYSLWSAEHLYLNPLTIPDPTDLSNVKLLFLAGNSNPDPTLGNGFVGFLNAEIGASANLLQVGAMSAVRNADGGTINPR